MKLCASRTIKLHFIGEGKGRIFLPIYSRSLLYAYANEFYDSMTVVARINDALSTAEGAITEVSNAALSLSQANSTTSYNPVPAPVPASVSNYIAMQAIADLPPMYDVIAPVRKLSEA